MKLAVVAANGKAGRHIVQEAVDKGLDVTAIVRGENKTAAQSTLQKDLFDLTKEDIKDFDVIIDAFGTWAEDSLVQHTTSIQHLADLVEDTDKRLLIVGGAGSLYLTPEHDLALYQSEGFPEAFKPLATAMSDSLVELRKRNNVKWTYVSPAADFQADGEPTGDYVIAGEEFTLNDKGESIISYADYAKAMINIALEGNYVGQRISVFQK
ncbi:SDR family oxidoreductase [Lactococcus garvieae]|jgi:putative NADH-flavin reductase|uniref:SDR family oxidoreductase n=1 Tax=Lactococcus garvieae TaxID=1363 RepID=UPI0009C159E3|nr:NAD(P)H-binding protein [Lactococcus garvieae]QPS71700.1 NAD(P)H-binding protein [Lactococcus garvieae]